MAFDADFQDYSFGASEVVPKSVFKEKICHLISSMHRYGPVVLVFHDNSQDIKLVSFLKCTLGLT